MTLGLDDFITIWCVDFEYQQPDGEVPRPLCMVAREFRTGRLVRLWRDDLLGLKSAPFPVDADALFVAYNASAELGCFLVLGWPFPCRILDPYVEFRGITSGLSAPCGHGLLGCLSYFKLDAIDGAEKEAMRELAMRGGDYSDAEKLALLDYCQTDVDALTKLLPVMMPKVVLGPALFRGRYMAAVARMQHHGVPIDVPALETLRAHWARVQDRLIERVDGAYGVFEGSTFKADRWAAWLAQQGIPWPLLDSGNLDLKIDTFADVSQTYPQVEMMYQLRESLSQMRLASLQVGSDGRNRTSLFPFGSKTGRNQPSTTKFVFGLSAWQRGLIRPAEGQAIAYVDWSQQEFGIAAALSGDEAMMDAYASGDPYLEFAKQAGMAPPDATKATHKAERDLCKACILGVQYGMAEHSLARRINKAPCHARELLRRHHATYPAFWAWSGAAEQHAMLHGSLSTVWGWPVHVGHQANPRSLRNFPMQANGAEMMRLACSTATEAGIKVCAPVHDAILIEAPIDAIDEEVEACQAVMVEASESVLDGFALRSDAKVVRAPDRYDDERGQEFWRLVWDSM